MTKLQKSAVALMTICWSLLFTVAAVGPSRIAAAAVNMSTVAASGNYLATAVGPTSGFMSGAFATKLNALPDNATLASTYATQTSLADKTFDCGHWGSTGAPATTSARWLQAGGNGAVLSVPDNGWIVMPFDGTATEIVARNAIGVAATMTYTLELDGTPTALAVAVPSSQTTVASATGSIAFSKGQYLGIRAVEGASTAAATATLRVGIRCKSSN